MILVVFKLFDEKHKGKGEALCCALEKGIIECRKFECEMFCWKLYLLFIISSIIMTYIQVRCENYPAQITCLGDVIFTRHQIIEPFKKEGCRPLSPCTIYSFHSCFPLNIFTLALFKYAVIWIF